MQIDQKIILPKIKESMVLNTGQRREVKIYPFASSILQDNPMMKLREIQKNLFKLRNGRIGKKILILNSYGM